MAEKMDPDELISSQMRAVLPPDEQTEQSPEELGEKPEEPEEGAHGSDVAHEGLVSRPMEETGTVSLQELKRLPQCNTNLGSLSFSSTHTVFVNVDKFNSEKVIVAVEGRDIWGNNFVKMPCSSDKENKVGLKATPLFFLKTPKEKPRLTVISKHLGKMSKKSKAPVSDVKKAILKYNPEYKDQWSFDALETFVQSLPETEMLFPKIAALALKLPHLVPKTIPLLRSGHTASITLSQVQISCLLANAFFCTFPHRNSDNSEYRNYPTINFSSLFAKWSKRKNEKLKAIMHYFSVVTSEDTTPEGLVTFERRCLQRTDMPDWENSQKLMPKLHVTSQGSMETEGVGLLQMDFASPLVGGGVLNNGLLQEQILFVINPELIAARLFTEKLNDLESLLITGPQRFSRCSGFRDKFLWLGPYEESVARDEWGRLQRQIVAIDAMHFKQKEQYNMKHVERELNKAFCGFKGHGDDEPDIATGKWGCGFYNGDPQLKALIQLMAAAEAHRGMAMFTFSDETLTAGLQQIYSLLRQKNITVGNMYRLLKDYCDNLHTPGRSQVDLFDFVLNKI